MDLQVDEQTRQMQAETVLAAVPHTQQQPALEEHGEVQRSLSAPELSDKLEDEELPTTDTSRGDDDVDADADADEGEDESVCEARRAATEAGKAEQDAESTTRGEHATPQQGHRHGRRAHRPREDVPRAASMSSLSSSSSGAGSAGTAATMARRANSKARLAGRNSLRADPNLKIFLPSDSPALKAILSPQTLSPQNTLRTAAAKHGNATAQQHAESTETGGSPNLLDKLLFRGGHTAPGPITVKKSMGSGADEDLEALNSNVVVLNDLPPPPFANMFTCESCRQDIGSLLSQGRHHCRNCGGSFCGECSKKTIAVPFKAYLARGEQRVCEGCYHRIQNFQSQVKSTSVTWSGLKPPANEVFVRDFGLLDDETPVSVFNCALFQDTTPFYGHLALTRKRLCFQGYHDSLQRKLSYAMVLSLLKPQFYYINGLQVKTKRKEAFFLAEFNGLRDMCFSRLDQLIRAYQEASRLKEGVTGKSPSSKELHKQMIDRRRSYRRIAEHMVSSSGPPLSSSSSTLPTPPVSGASTSTVGFIDANEDDEARVETPLSDIVEESAIGDGTDDGKSCTSDEEPFEPLPPDPLLEKMTVLLDCDLRADVKRVFDLLWNDGAGQEFLYSSMEKSLDINIDVEAWKGIEWTEPTQADAIRRGFEISKEEDYTLYRMVRSEHPPKISFPGLPPYAGCTRMQRFRLAKSSHGGDKWDRFVVSELNSMSKIPFSDYFEIETRYVFTRDGKNYCHVQAGLVVNFRKATWFKSQINSSTRSESKEALEAWAKRAIEFLEVHENRAVASPGLPPSVASRAARTLSAADSLGELESIASGQRATPRKRSESSARSGIDEAWSRAAASASASAMPASPSAKTQWTRATQAVWSPVWVVQLVAMALMAYCLVLLHGQQMQMQQLTMATAKLVEHLQNQQLQQQAQSLRAQEACEGNSVAAAMQTLKQFVDVSVD